MKLPRKALFVSLLACSTAFAVYAPIPEREQGKAWSATLRAGFGSDSNLFGTPDGETDSVFATALAKIAFNASLTDQTFASAHLQTTFDHFEDRPGDKDLMSHELLARIAHSVSRVTSIDVYDFFQITENPESLLAGIPLSTEQSFKRNQFDSSFSTAVTGKISATVKYRNVYYANNNAILGADLDRAENLYGLAGTYGLLPEIKLVGEYRHLDIAYDRNGGLKDKKSDFLLAGVDYTTPKKITLSARLGAEWRDRKGEDSTTSPSAEFSVKYDYADQSFVAAGYAYALEEASNVALYTDSEVNRVFANVQHAFTPIFVGSASLTCESSKLQRRAGQSDIPETTLRLGVGFHVLFDKNWSLSATYDWDRIDSDDSSREMERHRFSLLATFAF